MLDFVYILIIMNKVCYSEQSPISSAKMQKNINIFRIENQLRVLWPDYEVYDLIAAGVSVQQLTHFTSSPLTIHKITNAEEINKEPFNSKQFTHVAVHKIVEFGTTAEKVEIFLVILSRRGFAVDEFNSKFVRGSYIISAQIAAFEKQTSFWGVEYLSSQGTHIISTKYVSKANSMWRLQFESPKSLKSILFYSTKRQPRYGKSSSYENELPKDAKLQFCMKVRIFPSFVESLMSKDERIYEGIPHFISPKRHHPLFSKTSDNKQPQIGTQIKSKNEETPIMYRSHGQSNSKKKETKVKILSNSSILQILSQYKQKLQGIDLQEVRSFIEGLQKSVHDKIEANQTLTESIKETLLSVTFAKMVNYSWNQIKNLLQTAIDIKHKDLQAYLLGSYIHVFAVSQEKTIDEWTQIYEYIFDINEEQERIVMIRWMEQLMNQYCHDLLKDCDQDALETIKKYKEIVVKSIQNNLERNCNNSKICDLLYILMKIEEKKDIFDLYQSHHLTNSSVVITHSLKKWQEEQSLYAKHDADVLYQTEASFQTIQYQPTNPQKPQSKVDMKYDFSIVFTHDNFPKNGFLSGKSQTIGTNNLKYFISRNEGNVFCFIQEVAPLNALTYEQTFTSFDIQVEITINNQKKSHLFGWSFTTLSHSIGTKFMFSQLQENANIECKISFRRSVIHDSILSYLRIRYEQLLKMQNKCSQKIESQNQKLLKRRSSLYLERNLYDSVNFCNKIDQQCFLHSICQNCEALSQQTSIFRLHPLDLYKLMLSASFKDQIDALLVTIKYLIITPRQIQNRQFWLSQLRIRHLNLQSLLRLINKKRLDTAILQIISSLIDQKVKQNVPKSEKVTNGWLFIKGRESRIGRYMWYEDERDYSQDYLEYLNNVHEIL